MSSIRPWRDIARRQSRQIMVGSVPVGGDAPITVQTMTNTPTAVATGQTDEHRRGWGQGGIAGDCRLQVVEDCQGGVSVAHALERATEIKDSVVAVKRAFELIPTGACCRRR